MREFEVTISEIDDITSVASSSHKAAVRTRLQEIDPKDLVGHETLEIVVHDDCGMKSVFEVALEPLFKFRLSKVG